MKCISVSVLIALLAGWGIQRSAAVEHVTVARIMPLGDSITQGNVQFNSYRPTLWRMLNQAGYQVDFVGSLRRHHGGDPRETDYDPDHEGHWGWAIDRVLPELPGWLAEAKPDVILLHLGTNDALRRHPDEETVQEWLAVLRLIHAQNPQICVLAARLIPAVGEEALIERLNGAFEKAWAEQPIPDLDLRWVDQFSGFDPNVDTWDGLHPNQQGERKLAERWFAALREVLPAPADKN